MRTPRARLAKLLAERTLKQGVSKRLDKEVAAYLLSEGRVNELDSLLRDVQADWAAAGHVEVIARSAYPLSAAIKADIRREVKKVHPGASRIVINEVIDPDMVGGVRLNLPNRQLDLSIRSKLNTFKQSVSAGKE